MVINDKKTTYFDETNYEAMYVSDSSHHSIEDPFLADVASSASDPTRLAAKWIVRLWCCGYEHEDTLDY